MSASLLHLGCGRKKEAGAFGVDFKSYPGVDLVHDLNLTPYPLDSNRFEKIVAVDVLEHLDNFIGAIEEMHRLARDGGEIVITGPYATSLDRHTDPTHRRGFTHRSFDYFIEGTDHFTRYQYSTARFALVRRGFCRNEPHTLFSRAMVKLANTWPGFYERKLRHVYPMDYMYFVLRALKA